MTTVVYYNGILAADSQVTAGNIKQTAKKIRKHKGVTYSIAGDYANFYKMHDYIETGKSFESDDFSAIILKDGKAYFIEEDFYQIPIEEFTAIGSGSEAANAAYHAFKESGIKFTAKDIVKIACKVDINSSGKIQVAKL